MHRARLSLLLCAAALLLLVLGFYLLLPALLERLVAGRMQEQLGAPSTPEVELRAEGPPGRFSGGRVTVRGAEFGGVQAARTVVDLDPFVLDLPGSVASLELETGEPVSGALRVELSESEVARLAREEADIPVRGVELEEGGAVVGSEVRALGVTVPLSVRGEVSLRNGALRFEPREISAAGVPVGEELAEKLLVGGGFEYVPRELPYGTELTGVGAREGHLVLEGVFERLPLGGG